MKLYLQFISIYKKLKIMTLQLNQELKKDVLKGQLKAVKLVNYLINQGFKTNQEPQKTSLNDLTFNNKKIKKAYLNNFQLIIKF